MTLEHLARDFRAYSVEIGSHFSRGECDMIAATLDAAIRERNQLRKMLNDMRSERNTIRRERAQENKKWNTVRSELAMLKAKIADAPIASVRVDDRMHVSIGARSCAVDFVPLHTKRVRLVVDE